jgi:short chain dehydrogenase
MVRCCKAFLPLLKEQATSGIHTGARILNLTSMAGLISQGAIGLAAYSASKHAANTFSHILRTEVFPSFKIQVTTINPSFHGTPLVHAMGDMASKQWDSLEYSIKAEYGEGTVIYLAVFSLVEFLLILFFLILLSEYYRRYRELAVDLPLSLTWDTVVVIRQVVRCLRMKHAPAELIVGSDARFLLMLVRMLPSWLISFVVQLNTPPIPAAMKKR